MNEVELDRPYDWSNGTVSREWLHFIGEIYKADIVLATDVTSRHLLVLRDADLEFNNDLSTRNFGSICAEIMKEIELGMVDLEDRVKDAVDFMKSFFETLKVERRKRMMEMKEA